MPSSPCSIFRRRTMAGERLADTGAGGTVRADIRLEGRSATASAKR